MKLHNQGNEWMLIAETDADILTLIKVARNGGATRKPTKRQFTRKCDVQGCTKEVKGAIGLGIHKKKVHGIKGKYVG